MKNISVVKLEIKLFIQRTQQKDLHMLMVEIFLPIGASISLLNISSNEIKLLLFNTNLAASKINSLQNLIGIRFLCFIK